MCVGVSRERLAAVNGWERHNNILFHSLWLFDIFALKKDLHVFLKHHQKKKPYTNYRCYRCNNSHRTTFKKNKCTWASIRALFRSIYSPCTHLVVLCCIPQCNRGRSLSFLLTYFLLSLKDSWISVFIAPGVIISFQKKLSGGQ